MNDIINKDDDDFMNDDNQFAVSDGDYIKLVINEYNNEKDGIETVVKNVLSMQGMIDTYLHYFQKSKHIVSLSKISDLFDLGYAIKKLNAKYWNKLIVDSKLIDVFPTSKRNEWNENIANLTTPDFKESIVRDTYTKLISERWKYFADKIDDIFRHLSKTHLTNSPEGFNKRMILNYCFNTDYRYCFNHTAVSLIHDLRCVLFKFYGMKDELSYNSTSKFLNYLLNNVKSGEWFLADSGLFKIRWYLKGTVHIEINPDVAWKLNKVLSLKYPQAIPANYRTKPTRKVKDFTMIENPIPQNVLHAMSNFAIIGDYGIRIEYDFQGKKEILERVNEIMGILGGVKSSEYKTYINYKFDYNPQKVFEDVIFHGAMPDQKTHQFYPTPEIISEYVMRTADVKENDKVLEPSAGRGNLLRFLPSNVNKHNITCIEISEIFSKILLTKYPNTLNTDFLKWAEKALQTNKRYDKIIMNPPFSDGRCVAHIQAAAKLLNTNGRLVAVLPSTYENKLSLFKVEPTLNVSVGEKFKNEFDDTSIEVMVLIIDRV